LKNVKIITLAALLGAAAAAQAQVTDVVADLKAASPFPYVIDQRGVVARSGTGLCWRTGYWTPALAEEAKVVGSEFPAGCSCDKDLMPKAKCEPKAAPAPVAATPAAPAAPAAPVMKTITLSSKALFAFNKAVLTPEGKATLDKEIVAKLGEIKKITFMLVTGHTDRIGSQQYNQKLSEKRADAVKAYLVTKGIDANVIETMGAGKTQPVPGVSCDDKLPRKKLIECLAPNRRVVVEVKGDPK
jgi:OOP family OmpA-OmpF porin